MNKVEKYVHKLDEDEILRGMKIRTPRDREDFIRTEFVFYYLMIKYGDLQLAYKEYQQACTKEWNQRKSLEKREDTKKREEALKRSRELFDKLNDCIITTSRLRAQVEIHKNGDLTWKCPTQGCPERQAVSLIQENLRNFSIDTHEFMREFNERGKSGLTDAFLGHRRDKGGLTPIIDDLANGNEVTLVMRCPRCFHSDDLKLQLRRA